VVPVTTSQNPVGLQLAALRDRIAGSNEPGDIEGLFARFLLGDVPAVDLRWAVDQSDDEVRAKHHGQTEFPAVAALGYMLYATAGRDGAAREAFDAGVARLRQRDPFPHDRQSFGAHPLALIGLALGARAIAAGGEATLSWIGGVIRDERSRQPEGFAAVLRDIALSIVAAGPVERPYFPDRVDSFALALWATRRALLAVRADLTAEAAQIRLAELVSVDPESVDPTRAAAIYAAITLLLPSAIESALGIDAVASVLARFQDALRRWPNQTDGTGWPLTDEKKVQAVVYVVLRSVFPDVIDEETLTKVGLSSYIPDYAIPSLRLLIEVKFARVKTDLKKIEKEILEDSAAYPMAGSGGYDQMIVFIYDDSASVQLHGVVRDALQKVPFIRSVIFATRPS
jgi:hypothetical protein